MRKCIYWLSLPFVTVCVVIGFVLGFVYRAVAGGFIYGCTFLQLWKQDDLRQTVEDRARNRELAAAESELKEE